MKKFTPFLLGLASFSAFAQQHALDPLNITSGGSLSYNGDAQVSLDASVRHNLQLRAFATDTGKYTFGGGFTWRLSERDTWGSGLLLTGISGDLSHTNYENIGTKTSATGKFTVSEYLNRQRNILLSGSVGGKLTSTDYYDITNNDIAFIADGTAAYIKHNIYAGVRAGLEVDAKTQIGIEPIIGYTNGVFDISAGYLKHIKDERNLGSDYTVNLQWLF